MDKKEYLDKLSSPHISLRREALESSYVPKSKAEIDAAIASAMIAKPDLHELLFEHITEGDVSSKLALPVYVALATRSQRSEMALKALEVLSNFDKVEATNAILICASHGDIDIQKAAIDLLADRSTEDVTELLRERIDHPQTELYTELTSNENVTSIKRAAIRSLGAQDKDFLIDELVEIARNQPEFLSEVGESLVRINTPKVVEILLGLFGEDIVSAKNEEFEFLVMAAHVIGNTSHANDLLNEYHPILHEVYTELMSSARKGLSSEIIRYFDETTGQLIVELIVRRLGGRHAAFQIMVNDLSQVPLELSFPSWLALLDINDQLVYNHATSVLIQTVNNDFERFCELMADVINQGDRDAHQQGRLLKLVRQLSTERKLELSNAVSTIINDDENAVALRYLDTIWNGVSHEERNSYLNGMLQRGYLANNHGRQILTEFILKWWDATDSHFQQAAYNTIMDNYSDDNEEISQDLLWYIAENATDTVTLVEFMIHDLKQFDEEDAKWHLLADVLDNISPRQQPDNVRQLKNYCRDLLSNNLDSNLRPIIINILAKYEDHTDTSLFKKYISRDFHVDTQIAAVNAFRYQPVVRLEEILVDQALKSWEPKVVLAAIKLLAELAVPSPPTILALQERSTEDSSEEVIQLALEALDTITQRHIANPVNRDTPNQAFENWLQVLRYIGPCNCDNVLESLLHQHADSQYADRRISIILTLSKSTIPWQYPNLVEWKFVSKKAFHSHMD